MSLVGDAHGMYMRPRPRRPPLEVRLWIKMAQFDGTEVPLRVHATIWGEEPTMSLVPSVPIATRVLWSWTPESIIVNIDPLAAKAAARDVARAFGSVTEGSTPNVTQAEREELGCRSSYEQAANPGGVGICQLLATSDES
jgi:hypothetical protein